MTFEQLNFFWEASFLRESDQAFPGNGEFSWQKISFEVGGKDFGSSLLSFAGENSGGQVSDVTNDSSHESRCSMKSVPQSSHGETFGIEKLPSAIWNLTVDDAIQIIWL